MCVCMCVCAVGWEASATSANDLPDSVTDKTRLILRAGRVARGVGAGW